MPKIVDARSQRGEIRRAARRVFSRHGVAGTGLARVAAAAGMGRSSLYHYYPDKASLLRDLIRDLLEEEEALFREALGGEGDALERIERLMAVLAGMFEAWAGAGRMVADLRLRDARLFRPFFRRVRRALAAAIEEGRESGAIHPEVDAELAAATLIGAVDGLLLQRLVDPAAFSDPARMRDALVSLTRRSLAP